MNSQKLIALYCYIYDCYNTELFYHCERFSRNRILPKFTDIELLTIYLYSVSEEEKYELRSIYRYADCYLRDWFPDLPSYQTFTNRLNRLSSVFAVLVDGLLRDLNADGVDFKISLVDSMPIITCSGKRKGKVATELTSKGYCSSKGLHYHGIKLHAIGFENKGTLPHPEYFRVSDAATHDLNAIRELLPNMKNRTLFADKAYIDQSLSEQLSTENNVDLYTPIKLKKGECDAIRKRDFAFNQLFSKAVSSVRQPIESLFNWINNKTKIQNASKVRSTRGLLVHTFGKIASALVISLF